MNSSTLNLANEVFLRARTQPQRTAVVVDEQEFSYAALADMAGRVAAWLRATEVAPAHHRAARIGVLAARSVQTYAGIVGAAWAGGTYVPLNPKQPAARLNVVIERAALDALVVDARGAQRLTELAPAARGMQLLVPDGVALNGTAGVSNITRWSQLSSQPAPLPPTPVAPDHPAYIIFTSGTTGLPKGVIVSAANIAHTLACLQAMYQIGPDDRAAQFFDTTFDVSVAEMFACWNGGAALHVVPETKQMAPGGFIRQRGITIWHAVPSLIGMMQRLKQLEPGSLPSLRHSVFGGEGVPVASLRAWQAAAPNSSIHNQYGPTEVAVACVWHCLTEPPIETPGRGTLAIGKPFPGMHAAILDEQQNILPTGQTGELAICGPQVAAGYLNDDEQTARRFRTLDHPQLGRSRWYLTGDAAYVDDHGLLHCLGRMDNQVKVMGHRVELEEIEAHLRALCRTDSVAAVAWPVVNGNPAGIIAFVSGGANGNAADGTGLREAMKGRVPAYMIPSRVIQLEALPLSTNGKIDRQGLRTLLEEKVVT